MRDIPKSEISKKAKEIHHTLRTITDLIPDDNEYLKDVKSHILENIMILQAKLYSAERMKLWDLKMENAAIIRKNARELMVQYHSLKMFGFEDVKYYKMVREQLEEFRLLFRDWVSTFNPKHFIVDEWGLFNPPGIDQDYEQRDDELNFLNEDEDEF
ncbi:hypothetical protein [Frigoriflavimonas asaccharolytica]|uniref:Uncharacterized protein n=1 Tax=Frigoriflavimonas asaccharolytica TaxID=2735899 RepID=A0A8J8G7H0_9FLAO|nr:hypothetical protein [Frigoriflavimonas asaccharolytica]NRS92090.1 hypothetical protein [Frigoriflavimonas asaccharolytica]